MLQLSLWYKMAKNIFEITTSFLSCQLFGASATAATLAPLGAVVLGGGYTLYKILNDKELRQDLLKPFENRNATVADVNKGSIVITVATDNEESARTIEDDCKSNKILVEINEQIRKYNEVNEENVDYFTNIEVIKVETVTLAADDWKKLKEKFKENIDKVFETEMQPYKDESVTKFLEKFGHKLEEDSASTEDNDGQKRASEPGESSFYIENVETFISGDININIIQKDEDVKALQKKMELMDKKLLELKEIVQKQNASKQSEMVAKVSDFEKDYWAKKELQKEKESKILEVMEAMTKISLFRKQMNFPSHEVVPVYMLHSPENQPLKALPALGQHSEQTEKMKNFDDKLQELESKFEKKYQELHQEFEKRAQSLFQLYDDVRQQKTFIHEKDWLICQGAELNKIFYCKEPNGNTLYIKKVLYKHPYVDSKNFHKFLRNCKEEIQNIRLLSGNKYILKYINHKEANDHFEIVTELCNGNVEEYATCLKLQSTPGSSGEWPKPLPRVENISELRSFAIKTEDNFLSYFKISPMEVVKQMVEGIHNLHCINFAHQDVKPGNFLLKKQEAHTFIKVGDFGISRKLHEGISSRTIRGTPGWLSPELLNGEKSVPVLKSDIFSLGLVVSYTLSRGIHPFGKNCIHRNYNISEGAAPDLDALFKNSMLTIEEKINACDLILWMLQHKPENRPSCAEVKSHPMLWNFVEKVEFLMVIATKIQCFESKCNTMKKKDERLDKDNQEKQPTAQSVQQVSEHDTTQVLQPAESDATAFLAVSEEKPFNMIESVNGLEQYPTWLIDGLKSGEEEMCHFVIKRDTLRELGEILQLGEQRTKCSSVKEILFIMKATKEDESLSDETKDKLGLGENKDWEKFYSFFTKENPQILARTYQLFKSHPELREFKQALLEQDRGPAE